MWTALLSKELRECGLYALVAMAAQIHFLGAGMDVPLIPLISNGRGAEIPFVASYSNTRESTFTTIAILAAIVLGLHQTAWESWRQTTLFLLHRPIPRTQIFLAKLTTGTFLLMGIAALPLLVYCLWAATPGTHASPFYWSMTESWWRSVAVCWVCYLGAFLTGLRPAYWLGSRTWPLITALLVSICLKVAVDSSLYPIFPPLVAAGLCYTGCILMGAGLIISILQTAHVREYP